MADNLFCLDISEKYIKVVDSKKNNEIIEINSIGKIDSKVDFFSANTEKLISEQADIINQLVNNLKINKKNVNIIIPDSLTYNQVLTMPALNEKELVSAIKYQADQFIPMPIEETNIDIEVIEELKNENKILILIAAAEKKLIEKIQTTVELAGLIPESIESELSSNARFFQEINKKNNNQQIKESFLLVNFDYNSSSISYFNDEKLILKENHNLNFGYQLFLKEIKVNADVDEKKAAEILQVFNPDHQSSYPIETIIAALLREFVLEIKRFIGLKKIDRIYFINQIVNFPSLPYLIKKYIDIPIEIFNPYNLIKKSTLIDQLKNYLPLYISAIGGNFR